MNSNDPTDPGEKDGQRMLEEAFERFNEASTRLQARYEILAKETDDLRNLLKEKDQEIQKAERLSTLGETAAAMAHEVRNPLGAIKLFISLLRRDMEDRPSAMGMLNEIDKSIATIDSVVSNILHFSKDQRCSFAPVNVQLLLEEEAKRQDLGHQGAIAILTEFAGSPYVNGNEYSLRRVFHNLLLNACQAVKHGGEIRISTCDAPDGHLKVVVADNGPGVAEDNIGRIFEPFVTTKNEGTGLGLAVVRQIVSQHGGSISVANSSGAQFTVLLPRKHSGS